MSDSLAETEISEKILESENVVESLHPTNLAKLTENKKIQVILRTYGDPILRTVAEEVTEINDEIKSICDALVRSMIQLRGAGLAANQIGINKRIIAVTDQGGTPIIMINPIIIEKLGEQVEKEGCLSFPEVFAKVKRPKEISLTATSADGKQNTFRLQDMDARKVCHEVDHLNGVLFCDHFDKFAKMISENKVSQIFKKTKKNLKKIYR